MICFVHRSSQLIRSLCLFLALLILLSGFPACAVDIVMTYAYRRGPHIVATCPSLPPGICCEAPRRNPDLFFSERTEQTSASVVTFRGMMAGDFGAVWRFRNSGVSFFINYGGCSGTVMDTRRGPGDWVWRLGPPRPNRHWATGAQYISLPKALPPDPATNKWMSMQGILEMSFGGGKWFTTPTAERVCGTAAGGQTPKTKSRRDIRSPLKGDLCIGPAPRSRYPELMKINGTEYSDGGRGNLRYADAAGNVLNLTDVFRP